MDTYRWAEGFQSQRRRHLKRGCCFSCYFPLFLPSGEEQDYLGGRTLLGTSKWGSVGCKDGVYWIWGGLGGQNIARTKCGIGCGVGSGFFFLFFLSPFPFFKIGFAGIFLDWTERVLFSPGYSLHYPQHSYIHKCYLSPAKHKKKRWYKKRTG